MNQLCSLHELWQEAGDNQDDDANHQGHDGLLRTTLPFLQNDAPYVGEHHVECHQDAEGECHEGGGLCEESLAQRETEELAVPQGSGQGAEHEVVAPNFLFSVVAPSVVLAVLVEAVDGVGDETAKGYEEGGGEGLVHVGGQCAEVDVTSEGEAYVEASAHESGQQGDGQTLWEVEVLHRRLFLLLGKGGGFHRAGHADDGDAHECYHHAENHAEGERREGVHLREEYVEEHGTHDGAQSGASAEGDALAESHTQIAHGEAKGESAHTP